jgi:hypothetical protein
LINAITRHVFWKSRIIAARIISNNVSDKTAAGGAGNGAGAGEGSSGACRNNIMDHSNIKTGFFPCPENFPEISNNEKLKSTSENVNGFFEESNKIN